jgi:hypothetical protein
VRHPYAGLSAALTTMHGKQRALAARFPGRKRAQLDHT